MHLPPLHLAPICLLMLTGIARADAYDDALARAATKEREGDSAAAAQLLARAVADYPQDYAIAEALGGLSLRAGRYAEAERAYGLALARAPAALDSRLGLLSSLVYQRKCDAAEKVRTLLASTTRSELATRAHAPCEPPAVRLSMGIAANEYLFPDHPWKSNGTGGTVAAEATLFGRWSLGGAYRYVHFDTLPTSTQPSFAQNEGYVDLAWNRDAFGVALHGALVEDGTSVFGTSSHVGASLRVSALGDLLMDGSLSFYPDMSVLRVAPAWCWNITDNLHVQPGVAVIWASETAYVSGSVSALFDTPGVSVWGGGKYGEEVRPAYLSAHVVYDIAEHVLYGAWAGVRVRLAGPVGVVGTYAFDRLKRTDSLLPNESNLHALSIGPTIDF